MVGMCSRCRHFRLDPREKLSAHGFGQCAYLPVWRYRSRQAAGCFLNPSRHEEHRDA